MFGDRNGGLQSLLIAVFCGTAAAQGVGIQWSNTIEGVGNKVGQSCRVNHGESGRGVKLLQLLVEAIYCGRNNEAAQSLIDHGGIYQKVEGTGVGEQL
jgi:hypothetical protein